MGQHVAHANDFVTIFDFFEQRFIRPLQSFNACSLGAHWAPAWGTPLGPTLRVDHLRAARAPSPMICSLICPLGHPIRSPLTGQIYRLAIYAHKRFVKFPLDGNLL